MVERWLAVNREGEAKQDWRHMADLYTKTPLTAGTPDPTTSSWP